MYSKAGNPHPDLQRGIRPVSLMVPICMKDEICVRPPSKLLHTSGWYKMSRGVFKTGVGHLPAWQALELQVAMLLVCLQTGLQAMTVQPEERLKISPAGASMPASRDTSKVRRQPRSSMTALIELVLQI